MNNSSTETLSLFTTLLNLSDIEVINIRHLSNDREIVIAVKSTRSHVLCMECGKPTSGHGSGRSLCLRHLPTLGKKTYIEITPRSGRCENCDGGPTTTEQLDWYEANSKMTKPFEQYLLFELVNTTVSDVSRKEGVDNQVHILGVVEGREKAKIVAFLRKLPRRLRKTIQAACFDLYDGYMNACKEVFKKKVPVVADRFHVRKLYRKSVVNLRKSELVRLKKALTKAEYAKLKPSIAILSKHKDYFTESEKTVVEQLFLLSPRLKLAYQFSRDLSDIFDSHVTHEFAKEKMTQWIETVTHSQLACFNHFIKILSKYQSEISNCFIQCHNSGFVEGFNNKVKVLKRRCYGLSRATKLFQRLILDTMGLSRFASGVAIPRKGVKREHFPVR